MQIKTQYLLFLVNGSLLFIVSIPVQLGIFWLIGSETGFAYASATALTYAPLIVLNFIIQKNLIFSSQGRLWRFIIANLVIMSVVSLLSPICRYLLASTFGLAIGDSGGFMCAALIAATPSFMLAKFWVFKTMRRVT